MAKKAEWSTPLVSENLAQMVYERLEQAIMSGDLAPGERLSEASIARRFGISRGPLREAISRLEGVGLVTRVANQGTRVVDLSLDDLVSLFAVREALEGMACRLAANHASSADLEALESLLAAHKSDPMIQAGRGYMQGPADEDFHFRIAQASRNTRLAALICGPLYSVMRLYRRRYAATPGRPQKALEEHWDIIHALTARDSDAAEACMRRHIQNSCANLVAAFNASHGDPATQAASKP